MTPRQSRALALVALLIGLVILFEWAAAPAVEGAVKTAQQAYLARGWQQDEQFFMFHRFPASK